MNIYFFLSVQYSTGNDEKKNYGLSCSFSFTYMSGKNTPWNFEHFLKSLKEKKEILTDDA